MTNELIVILTVLVDFAFVLLAAWGGRSWLKASIVVNLVLIAVLGGKLIEVFGFVTNAGNVFYACVFLAMHVLVERYGRREGYRATRLGFAALVCFQLLIQLTVRTAGRPETNSVNDAMRMLFAQTPRIAFASVIAYVSVQHLNVWLYDFVKEKTHGSDLWLRHILCDVSGQFFDSIIFFTLAFAGTVPSMVIVETILIGFVLKVIVGLCGTPVLYLARHVSRPEPVAPPTPTVPA